MDNQHQDGTFESLPDDITRRLAAGPTPIVNVMQLAERFLSQGTSWLASIATNVDERKALDQVLLPVIKGSEAQADESFIVKNARRFFGSFSEKCGELTAVLLVAGLAALLPFLAGIALGFSFRSDDSCVQGISLSDAVHQLDANNRREFENQSLRKAYIQARFPGTLKRAATIFYAAGAVPGTSGRFIKAQVFQIDELNIPRFDYLSKASSSEPTAPIVKVLLLRHDEPAPMEFHPKSATVGGLAIYEIAGAKQNDILVELTVYTDHALTANAQEPFFVEVSDYVKANRGLDHYFAVSQSGSGVVLRLEQHWNISPCKDGPRFTDHVISSTGPESWPADLRDGISRALNNAEINADIWYGARKEKNDWLISIKRLAGDLVPNTATTTSWSSDHTTDQKDDLCYVLKGIAIPKGNP
jgi:hypothetical protein